MRYKLRSGIFVLATLLIYSANVFAQVQTYDQLISAIREVRRQTEARIEAAVQQEKVREAWETGKLIHEHVLLNKERANYGEQVLVRLSADLGISESELRRRVEFAKAYPIHAAPRELSWAHYRELLTVNDAQERETLTGEAVRGKWSQKQLREEIRRRNSSSLVPGHSSLPELKPGKLNVYRISKNYAGDLYVDLGFSNYLELDKKSKLKEGDIVQVTSDKRQVPGQEKTPLATWHLSLVTATEDDLFTYKVHVLEVIDGDTLRVEIDLGFGITTVQKLRLRGLDAPEIESAEGKEAKEFLKTLLSPVTGHSSPILIRTIKSDKYDRYLADLWSGKTCVNQEMIAQGLALPVRE